ncbi:hypothetical protein LIER_05397 [Lithospermum erythrorhizon]|uniref:Uncharacterized protein n=1 Tax=Lithospermum erythrorhizon TaxID=34254 RepID=A0AAV3P0E7_LITER
MDLDKNKAPNKWTWNTRVGQNVNAQGKRVEVSSWSPSFPAQDSLMSKRSLGDPSHEELISFLFFSGDKFLDLQGVFLLSYKWLLSSYEEASGSTTRVGQPEHELNTLKKEKTQEERVLQRRFKNLPGEHRPFRRGMPPAYRRAKAKRKSWRLVWRASALPMDLGNWSATPMQGASYGEDHRGSASLAG